MIRKARISDTEDILRIINHYAEKDLMLPRSPLEVYENIRDYFVYLENGQIVGCAALHIFWNDLSEIKSLAVEEPYQRKGIGRKLVKECVKEATELGISRLFVLTYLPDFFKCQGFKLAEKNSLPHKIWTECVNCHKFPECAEVALTLDLPASLQA
ncbi:MAG: N-acetyltransferase [Candidatus Brocadiales bacterium]